MHTYRIPDKAKNLAIENPELSNVSDTECNGIGILFICAIGLIELYDIFYPSLDIAAETVVNLSNELDTNCIVELPISDKNIKRIHRLEEINSVGIDYFERRTGMHYLEKYHPVLYRIIHEFFIGFFRILDFRISITNSYNQIIGSTYSMADVLSMTYNHRMKYISYAIPFSFLVFLGTRRVEGIMSNGNLNTRFHPTALRIHRGFIRIPNALFLPFGGNLNNQQKKVFEYMLYLFRRFLRK